MKLRELLRLMDSDEYKSLSVGEFAVMLKQVRKGSTNE